MLTLVRRARRRLFHNELLFQGANAGSAALVAFILLMLLGTQILRWEVALLLPLAAAAAGLYAARQRVPSAYLVAQIIDRRLALEDTLSTAFFFSQCSPSTPGSPEIRSRQMESAERMAASVDPRQAIPYSMPRSIYAMAALTLVAASLFGLRYGLTRSLDLHPPLARILQQTFGSPERTEEAKNMRKTPPPEPAAPDDNQSVAQEDDQQQAGQPPDQSQTPPTRARGRKRPRTIIRRTTAAKKRATRPNRPMETTRTGPEKIRATARPPKTDNPARTSRTEAGWQGGLEPNFRELQRMG